jgi:hypothetical protein
MNLRSPLEATVAVLVILVGILIGGMFAIFTRPAAQQTATSTVSSSATTRVAQRTPPAALRTAPPAKDVAPVRTATPAPAATAVPTATPAPTATPVAATPAPTATPLAATPAATPAPAAVAAGRPRAGSWRIEEANVQVGTIVWAGAGAPAGNGDAIVLDVHKESVAGHGVSPCERQTTLHAVVAAGSAASVPYREVNCSGVTSSGEMRVSGFSGDGRSFSGSFWSGGAKLGDFTASTAAQAQR